MSDYHLTAKESQKVERIVPLHQAKIHVAFRCDITLNDKKYKGGACALSEHLIVLCKKSMIGGSLSHLKTIHLLDIDNFSTSSSSKCKVTTETDSVQLESQACLRFARVLVRNYHVITVMFPLEMRFQFRPHDPSLFPPFQPKMSPSQQFQFCYNAYCSYFNVSYEHSVTQFYHAMVQAGNGVAELNDLPLAQMEVSLGDPLALNAVFAAMAWVPNIMAIVCHDIARPDIVLSLARMIETSSNLRLIDIHNCNAETGISELSEAVATNTDCRVEYWDLSGNNFRDMSPFCAALARTKAEVFYLNLAGTGLTPVATTLLFQSMSVNKHLNKLAYLDITGGTVTSQGFGYFEEYLEKWSKREQAHLKTLVISDIGGFYGAILTAVNTFKQPLEVLDVSRGEFKKPGVFVQLLNIVVTAPTLKEINLAGAKIKPDQIAQLIAKISKSSVINEMSLNLSNLGLSGKKLGTVLNALSASTHSKWISLAFENNGMSSSDVGALFNVVKTFPNLRKIALGGNFDKGSKNGAVELNKFLTIETLETFDLKGGKRKMGAALLPLIDRMVSNARLRSLDISQNNIGNEGIEKVRQLIERNQVLKEIRLDGSGVTDKDAFMKLLDAIAKSQSLYSCEFPIDDAYDIIQDVSSSDRKREFHLMSRKQKLAQNAMHIHLADAGIASELARKHIPELDDLLDGITVDVHQMLEGIPLNQHTGLASAFGLPMPHLQEEDDQTAGAIRNVSEAGEGSEDVYGVADSADVVVVEDTGADEEAGLQTLQFNSLCIRRPGFAEEARRRRSSIDDDETPDTPAPNMFQGLPPDMCPTAFD